MNGRSVLLVCGEMTDGRAWTPVVDRLDGWDVLVVPWPLGLAADIVEATREAVGTEVFDLVVTARSGAAAGVDLARTGQAKALIMVDGNDLLARHGKIKKLEGPVAGANESATYDFEPFLDAMGAGDADRAGALAVESFATGIATEHRALIESMLATYIASCGLSQQAAPVQHPWSSWLDEVAIPVLLVRPEQTAEPGTYSARSLEVLARQCPEARIVLLPLATDDPPGLTHPDEIAELVQQMTVAPDQIGDKVVANPEPAPGPDAPAGAGEDADIDAAIAVINAYYSSPEPDDQTMKLARAAASERNHDNVLDGLILLVVTLLAGRLGEQGPSEGLDRAAKAMRLLRRSGLI